MVHLRKQSKRADPPVKQRTFWALKAAAVGPVALYLTLLVYTVTQSGDLGMMLHPAAAIGSTVMGIPLGIGAEFFARLSGNRLRGAVLAWLVCSTVLCFAPWVVAFLEGRRTLVNWSTFAFPWIVVALFLGAYWGSRTLLQRRAGVNW